MLKVIVACLVGLSIVIALCLMVNDLKKESKKQLIIAVKEPDGVFVTKEEFETLNDLIRAARQPRVYNVRFHSSEGMIYSGYEIHISEHYIDFFNKNDPKQYGYQTYNTPNQTRKANTTTGTTTRGYRYWNGTDWMRYWGL